MTHIDGATQNVQLVSKSTLTLLGTYFRIPVSSRRFDPRTAFHILLDAKLNNGILQYPTISTRCSTQKGSERTKEPEEQRRRKIENVEKKKSPREFEPQYRIPTKRRRAIPSDHSDMAVLFGR